MSNKYIPPRQKKQGFPPYGSICLPSGRWCPRKLHPRDGYFYFHTGGRVVLEHIWLWEQWNGRAVPDGCVIHHRDENRTNNARPNLQCLTKAEHNSLHKLKWTGPCSFEGCRDKAVCKGLCDRHYHQAFPPKAKGTPEFKARANARARAYAARRAAQKALVQIPPQDVNGQLQLLLCPAMAEVGRISTSVTFQATEH